ncbi:Phosphatidylglycerol/phosphatidylinositol transfer protein [Brettanomyces nanus]|uniref:Phosphatidylglycerol/phosphatidylinositol transfer protein n=1 Tax=Eeniella nana TaxID=13502 RepID=A0A875S7X2_EENNA|nr:Phosphatidylglycerol/phosphatidylinositol transfer protein [Brettanomyces nanus]QPG77003.1 Phosphatidylglycerol/phosphatidylinositol transfer protein [Brettanomyces nanus]
MKYTIVELLLFAVVAYAFSVQHLLDGSPQTLSEPIPGESPLELCDADISQLLTLSSVRMDPVPPERGQNLTISAVGTLSKLVESGAYVDVDVSYGYIKIIHQTYDLCDELPQVDMTCPLKRGYYKIEKEVEIPKEVPPGKYLVVARAYTKDDELITCLTGEAEFPPYNIVSGLGQLSDELMD